MSRWLSPWPWLLSSGLIAALVLGYAFWAKHQQAIGYDKAQAQYRAQAVRTDLQRAAVSTPIAAQQHTAQVRIRTVTKTIVEKVPVYVQADACPLPGGFRLLHDAAAHGVLPEPAGLADAGAVPAQDAAATVADNYGTARETAERLRGLQSWVRAQQAVTGAP